MSRPKPPWPWLLVPGLALAALVAYLTQRFPEAVSGGKERMSLVYSLLLLALVGGSAALHWRRRPGHALRNTAVWATIGLALFVAYGFRFELTALTDRLFGELVPHAGVVGDDTVTFRAGSHGHFIVEAQVDGTAIRFLVDTGASDVILSPADAERLGFDLASLAYTRRYRTASGGVVGAPVRLRRITIGPITLTDVAASVNGAPLKRSLLGMSFLGRLSAYEVSRDSLTLRQ